MFVQNVGAAWKKESYPVMAECIGIRIGGGEELL